MDKQKEKLKQMLAAEREKIAGYEQIAKVHSAYISILLKKLGTTKDNMITITAAEVTEALKKYEARAIRVDGGCSLYCETIKVPGCPTAIFDCDDGSGSYCEAKQGSGVPGRNLDCVSGSGSYCEVIE